MKLSGLAKLVKVVKVVRSVLMILVFLVIAIPVALYIALSSDWAQNKIRTIGSSELSALLDTEVDIGEVSYSPFNRLKISDVTIADDNGTTAATIRSLDTRVEFYDLIFNQKIIVDYASINGLSLHLYRDSIGAPLNIARIISHHSSDDTDKPESRFRLRLNDVEIQSSTFTYDVLSEPETPERFNPSHIAVDNISLMAFAPVVANDSYKVWLRSLSCSEQSGLRLSDLTVKCFITPDRLSIAGLKVELPSSLLDFSDINIPIRGIKSIPSVISESDIPISLSNDSHVSLSDLRAFVPIFSQLPYTFDISLDAVCSPLAIDLRSLHVSDYDKMFSLDAEGDVSGYRHADSIYSDRFAFSVSADSTAIASYLAAAGQDIDPKVRNILLGLGRTAVSGRISGSTRHGTLDFAASTGLADVKVDGAFWRRDNGQATEFEVVADVDSLMLGAILSNTDLHSVSAVINAKGRVDGKEFVGDVNADISHLYFKGYRYSGINASATIKNRDEITGSIDIDDSALGLQAEGSYSAAKAEKSIKADFDLAHADLGLLHLSDKFAEYALSGRVSVDAAGKSIDCFSGKVNVADLALKDTDGQGFNIRQLDLTTDNTSPQGTITVASDYLNGSADGTFHFSTIAADFRSIAAAILPALVGEGASDMLTDTGTRSFNHFAFDFTISDTEDLCRFFNIPVSVIESANLFGYVDASRRSMFVTLDAPWILQGSNVIENTALGMDVNGDSGNAVLQLISLIPTKKGDMDVVATINGADGCLDTHIDWSLLRTIPINGNIDFSAFFNRTAEKNLLSYVKFNPGKINFGNEIWEISPSGISFDKGRIRVDNFALNAPSQQIVINGVAGQSDDDVLSVGLKDIELINIFETLEIDKALIGGQATGSVRAEGLLGKTPVIGCDLLKVKSIAYNYCTLGDADVKLSLDNGGKIFNFSATIDGEDGDVSYLDGFIEPATETLDLNINANNVKVGFMEPFMEAFTSHVEGFASGNAHLFGTFKNIDLTGDIYARDLKIKIDFTNTWYSASDSIHIRPGVIQLDKVGITDDYGHTAILDGWVRHKYFHDASFHFDVRDAADFLCYDVNSKISPDWYGRIFGNGTATIKGQPGVVDISANMTTAPHSAFTFVLSDRLDADEYSFITFRDVSPHVPQPDSIILSSVVPDKVVTVRNKKKNDVADIPTAYNMDISVDIRPQAEINIIMDPIGGDSIRSNGEGHMRMTYSSVDNDMRLYGTYTLEKGNYNFTLQDLIVKDLIIKEGSSIYFPGDPYKAKLNIMAYYPVQANLSDLDESFLQDKELNRTKVPVRALVDITGDMLQPDVSFDLEFPTLSQDIYRKVRSIISTEDMMNRQIIYLLAINRFYTPEYMASTTKGSELFSVVSSTISSRLSSMLGKLSDNWSIAPNLRSDRGDFSDLEVDLTLSSSLLNNRLLLNGNFGYRDKSLNTNQFVGDFDVEYLLNRSGEWRLKAYNRYNDQNYYLRTAQTTQGVGIQYRRDFDKFLGFLRAFRKKDSASDSMPADSVPADSTAHPVAVPPEPQASDAFF